MRKATAILKRLAVKPPRGVRVLSAAPSPRDKLDTNFDNPQVAFKSKTTKELVRAYLVYQLCSINWVVENNMMLMKRLRQLTGQRIFTTLMKATFFGQFVAGEDPVSIRPVINRLQSFGVKSILDYSAEEDLSTEEAEKREVKGMTSSASENDEKSMKQFQVEKRFSDRRYKVTAVRTYFYQNEATCEKNMGHFLMSIDAVHKATHSTGLMAVKLTALGRPQLLLQLSEVIMRARNYMSQLDSSNGTGNVLTYRKTVEDMERYFEQHLDKPDVDKFLKNITSDSKGVVHLFPWSDILDEDMNLSDTFRVPDPKTGQMRRLISQITREEEAQFRNMLARLNNIIKAASNVDVRIMVDAEQTYFQPAISRLTLEMMRRYNKDGKFLVWNTYQCYLKHTYRELVTDLEQAQRQNFNWAAKCVRGAYIEQERPRAAAMGYPDPICDGVEATTASYKKCITEVFTRVAGDMKGKINVMVASHNEDTVRYAIQQMSKINIKPEDKIVCFGQLLGMCDHVTFPLGQAGYSAYKYVPYGPIMEVLPYLSRRAIENRGFLPKVKKEKSLLWREIIRRIISGQMFYTPKGNYTPV